MNQLSRIEQARKDAKLRQKQADRFNAIRKAWNLVEPDRYDRDPQWLRIAASRAAKAGRLPRRFAGESVIMMLSHAGYSLLSSIIGSLPRRGDTIVEIDGNHTFIFEVMALGGDPPWRYSDPFRLKLRIHTKQIESHTP